jgi:hypothetical protein
MNEAEFIQKLQERAHQQEKIIKDMPFSTFFSRISLWLGHNPWRILVPLALILTVLFRIILGEKYIDFVLSLFRNL